MTPCHSPTCAQPCCCASRLRIITQLPAGHGRHQRHQGKFGQITRQRRLPLRHQPAQWQFLAVASQHPQRRPDQQRWHQRQPDQRTGIATQPPAQHNPPRRSGCRRSAPARYRAHRENLSAAPASGWPRHPAAKSDDAHHVLPAAWPNSARLMGSAASRNSSASSVENPSTIADAVPVTAQLRRLLAELRDIGGYAVEDTRAGQHAEHGNQLAKVTARRPRGRSSRPAVSPPAGQRQFYQRGRGGPH